MDKSTFLCYTEGNVRYLKSRNYPKETVMNLYNGQRDKSNLKSHSFLQINSCDINTPVKDTFFVHRKNGRLDYHILYVEKGSMDVAYHDVTYVLTPGDFAIYTVGEEQYYSRNSDSSSFYIHFNGFACHNILEELHLNGGVRRGTFSTAVKNLFLRIIESRYPLSAVNTCYMQGYLLQLLAELSHIAAGTDAPTKDERVTECIDYINNHYHTDIDNDFLASMAYLSKSYFLNRFKAQTGLSPHAYMQKIRLKNSRRLLLTTNLPIFEISLAVGYKDPLYFSRQFKKFYGMSPDTFRKGSSKD